MRDPHHELITPQQRSSTTQAPGGARYAAGPSKGRSQGETSAPGVAEELWHRGVPEAGKPVDEPSPLLRAAAEAALHRVARRRRRDPVQRRERVDVRYSDAEKKAITAKAKSLNIAAAHLVGAVVMTYLEGSQPLPEHRTAVDDHIDELAALRTHVSKVGTNVNQIAHRLNAGGDTHPVDTAVLAQAERTLNTVRTALATIDASADHAAGQKAV